MVRREAADRAPLPSARPRRLGTPDKAEPAGPDYAAHADAEDAMHTRDTPRAAAGPIDAPVALSPHEQQVLQGLAAGDALATVAATLKISTDMATSYLGLAKSKLFGMADAPAVIAVAYAVEAIPPPPPRDASGLDLSRAQRDLVPLVAQGMTDIQLAISVDRSENEVRAACRGLLRKLPARNRAHVVTRGWQYRLVTKGQVLAWLR